MNSNRSLVLASNSPRRKQILEDAGFFFTVKTKPIDESYPANLPLRETAKYIAEKKAAVFVDELNEDELIITADTVVICGDSFLGKPKDYDEAFKMISLISGRSHQVITGVCLMDQKQKKSFDEVTEVFFKKLSDEEINFYITNFKPYDKAGAYGIQEWIGLIGIEKIIGSYHNVVGLPVQRLYEELKDF